MSGQGIPQRVIDEWEAARKVIANAIKEFTRQPDLWCERNAEAILARLAGNKPPLLVSFVEEKE